MCSGNLLSRQLHDTCDICISQVSPPIKSKTQTASFPRTPALLRPCLVLSHAPVVSWRLMLFLNGLLLGHYVIVIGFHTVAQIRYGRVCVCWGRCVRWWTRASDTPIARTYASGLMNDTLAVSWRCTSPVRCLIPHLWRFTHACLRSQTYRMAVSACSG